MVDVFIFFHTVCNTVFTTTKAYSNIYIYSIVWFQSCFCVYRELCNISLLITFNLVQKCTQELMKEEL